MKTLKTHSHKQLASYLVEQYISDAPRRHVCAFKLGCIEPDKNYLTYVKGSIKYQWLRGHNWGNTNRYMARVSRKLERKDHFNLLDFYKLGKLIHYIADAFTFAHNPSFDTNLKKHRSYEGRLESYLPWQISNYTHNATDYDMTLMEVIRCYHNEYVQKPKSIHTDASFSIIVCSTILDLLFIKEECNVAYNE